MAGKKLLPEYGFAPPNPVSGGKKQSLPEGLRKDLDTLRSFCPASERLNAATAFAESAKSGTDISEAFPYLSDALQDPEEGIRSKAASAICLGLAKTTNPNYPELVFPLASAVTDPNPETRCSVVQSLGRLARKGNNHALAMIAIISKLNDTVPKVRVCACRAVREAGSRADVDLLPAMPGLTACISDSNPRVRAEAVNGIGKAALKGVDISGAIPKLISALTDPEAQVRGVAADALKEAGNVSVALIQGFMPDIIAALKDKKLVRGAREKCIRLVGTADAKGVDISDAIPFLVEGVTDADASVRLASASALADAARNQAHRKPIVLRMAELIASESPEDRSIGLRVIEGMASQNIDVSEASEAIPAVIAILPEDDQERLNTAIKILNSCFKSNFDGTREKITKGISEYIGTASFAREAERNSPVYVRTIEIFAKVMKAIQDAKRKHEKANNKGGG